MELDRRLFITSLGGVAAVAGMDHEARAEALEDYMSDQLEDALAPPNEDALAPEDDAKKFPTVADLEAQIDTRGFRRGAGGLFVAGRGNVKKLPPMPANATLVDYFKTRFTTVNHVLQSANRAMKTDMSEEDHLRVPGARRVADHDQSGPRMVGRAMFEPYVRQKVTFAIRYHQALRFYPDHEAGYEYPDL